jgi:hypothetical protein
MCSHYYSAYPQFEVAEEDADEGALRCAAGLSRGRDLVEEFVAYGVWPLAHGWALMKTSTLLMHLYQYKYQFLVPLLALVLVNSTIR